MTDTQDLIARLRKGYEEGDSGVVLEAATALEAAQAEIERLKETCYQHYHTACQRRGERDAALARLAELEKQEPVAVVTAVSPIDFIARVTNENAAVLCIGAKVYAAAGASPVQPAKEWTDENVIAWCIERGIKAAKQPSQPSRCSNCGKPEGPGVDCITGDAGGDGEWFCSTTCHDQHSTLGCPHGDHDGYRNPVESARLIALEAVQPSQAHYEEQPDGTVITVDPIEMQPVQGLQSVADALTIEQLNDKVERLMAGQPSQDAAPNAPWLTEAHMLCTDQGVPQGNISWRIKVLRELLAQPSQAPALRDEETAALIRFNETCEDGQEYDVRTSMMRRLAEIGVVRHLAGGTYQITEFGRAVLAAINTKGTAS